MGTIRLSLQGKKGVSLLVLIFAIVILSVFGMGLAMLMYAKFKSFPYVTSSHQAQALADAGIEFAVRLVRDNPTFSSNPSAFIPSDGYKYYAFGNGQFGLKYVPGCPDALYSKGTCGMATREVKISSPGLMFGPAGNTVYLSSAIYKQWYQSAMIYTGYRVEFTFCDPSRLTPPGSSYWSWIRKDSIQIAADQPVRIMRFGPTKPGSAEYQWVWDATCAGPNIMGCSANALDPGLWDGVSDPPNASVTPAWNVPTYYPITYDITCRPRSCSPDNTTGCTPWPTLGRTYVTCSTLFGGPIRDLFFGNWQGHFCFETSGFFTTPAKFYIAFDHAISTSLSPPPWSGGTWVRNKFIITVY